MEINNASRRMTGGKPATNWGRADIEVGSAVASFESGRIAYGFGRFDMEHHG
jgi:hypothetical protein